MPTARGGKWICRHCSHVLDTMVQRGEIRRRAALQIAGDVCPHLPDGSSVLRWVGKRPDGATLDEVAKVFDTSRERIRQVEAAALKKLAAVENGGRVDGTGVNSQQRGLASIYNRIESLLAFGPKTIAEIVHASGSTRKYVTSCVTRLYATGRLHREPQKMQYGYQFVYSLVAQR